MFRKKKTHFILILVSLFFYSLVTTIWNNVQKELEPALSLELVWFTMKLQLSSDSIDMSYCVLNWYEMYVFLFLIFVIRILIQV